MCEISRYLVVRTFTIGTIVEFHDLMVCEDARKEESNLTYEVQVRFIKNVHFNSPFYFRIQPDSRPRNFQDSSNQRIRVLI